MKRNQPLYQGFITWATALATAAGLLSIFVDILPQGGLERLRPYADILVAVLGGMMGYFVERAIHTKAAAKQEDER